MDSERTVHECRSSESGEAREQRLARDRARQRERRASETAETRERRLARDREGAKCRGPGAAVGKAQSSTVRASCF